MMRARGTWVWEEEEEFEWEYEGCDEDLACAGESCMVR
jgi:hypothetical protein